MNSKRSDPNYPIPEEDEMPAQDEMSVSQPIGNVMSGKGLRSD